MSSILGNGTLRFLSNSGNAHFPNGFTSSVFSPVNLKSTDINFNNKWICKGFRHTMSVTLFNYTASQKEQIENLIDMLNTDSIITVYPKYSTFNEYNISFDMSCRSLIDFKSDYDKIQVGETIELEFISNKLLPSIPGTWYSLLSSDLLINSGDRLLINDTDILTTMNDVDRSYDLNTFTAEISTPFETQRVNFVPDY